MKQIILAVTGASGALYARRLARGILLGRAHLHLVVSPHGRRLLLDELGLRKVTPASLADIEVAGQATAYAYHDIGARLASGSFRHDGMVICPCSANTLGAVSTGLSDNLITRAAQVTLKEVRRLVLVVREMPLSQIEIEAMLRVSRAGGIVCPASPGFYLQAQSVLDLVDFVVWRVLDLLDLPHDGPRWEETPRRPGDTEKRD